MGSSARSLLVALLSFPTCISSIRSSPFSSRQAVDLPPGCPTPLWTVSLFRFVNSSHNLDCYSGRDAGLTGCLQGSQWCDPDSDDTCTHCGVPLCSTGLPNQPLGFGPPDTLQISVSGSNTANCYDINPKGYRRHDLGNGVVECGTAARVMEFYGSTNGDVEQGEILYNPIHSVFECENGGKFQATGRVDFTYSCTRDSELNATCMANEDFVIPMTKWWFVDE
ncbi:hypothetical protein FQN51_001308 [Onygenales sp. PD_10]|nr:hypothetical protein FQN51_001308 [Onygenales sp. PD_10]